MINGGLCFVIYFTKFWKSSFQDKKYKGDSLPLIYHTHPLTKPFLYDPILVVGSIDLSMCRYYDVKSTTLYQHCVNFGQYIIDDVMQTLIQRYKRNVNFTKSSRCRYYDVARTLRQFCKERKMCNKLLSQKRE